MAVSLTHPDVFSKRHIGPDEDEQLAMLQALGLASLEELVDATVPKAIRLPRPLDLPAAVSESQLLEKARELAARNKVFRSFLGAGYSDCVTPPVIQRNILENPGWYTAYTPYQAEIAQGRLEALLNYQTMVEDLTGLPIANASLLDEGTAAAEAMTMLRHIHGKEGKTFFVSEGCHPQTIDIVRTRAKPLGIEIAVGDHRTFDLAKTPVFGVLVQYPATDGPVHDYRAFVQKAHDAGALVAMAADLLALAMLVPPGELGADVALGSSQRFGVPLGYGGPHAAYFAAKQEHVRSMPGRIIGVSQDAHGQPALRMALGTREQHIRREKATSNICTAQVLLAVIAGSYAVYHGPRGIRAIAERVQALTGLLAEGLKRSGFKPAYDSWFDTVRVDTSPEEARRILAAADAKQLGFRRIGERAIGISLDETHSVADVDDVLSCFREGRTADPSSAKSGAGIPKGLERTSPYLTHPVFSRHHSETEMLRYLRMLESRDLSLTHSMIPLGSCTMKLNATAEMMPVTMPGFGKLHPFAPRAQAAGYTAMFEELEKALAEITGFPGISLQPNAGSQGEYAGLLVIRRYQESRGQGHRSVCLIPESAHGTNPASAAMAGLKVVVVKCDDAGNIDLADLEAKANQHAKDLCALMVTYPSTHGVFEEDINKVCSIVHEFGGQVYMDGANMNAQVGLTRPGDIGADVCHLNLHKTFCLAAGTQVTLADGTSRPIEQLLAGSSVLAWSDAEKGVRPESLQAVFRTGRKACVEVMLQDGRKITCTPDHRVLTTQGWVEAGDLTAGHRVVVGPDAPLDDLGAADGDAERRFRPTLGGIAFSMTAPVEREKTLAFFRLLGATCSDGSFSRERTGRQAGRVTVRLNFGTRLDAFRAIEDIARLCGSRPAISRGNGLYSLRMPMPLARAIEAVPGMGETGKRVESERLLPDFVSDLDTPNAVLREFLGALFGGDGCAPVIVHLAKNPATLKPVRFCQTRANPRVIEALQRQICEALGRLGVVATPDKLELRSDKKGQRGPGVRPRWHGVVTVVDSLRFAERVGFRYCAHKAARLSAAVAFWRMKGTIHAQRVAVAKRALENVAAAGIVRLGPKSVWRAAVDTAYSQIGSEQYIVNPYYASFEGSARLSKQHLSIAVNGSKGLRKDIRGLRRTNRRVLVAAAAQDGSATGVAGLLEFLAEIGAGKWFSSHHERGIRYKVTYAASQEAVVEPTMNLRVLDVRPVGDREVYDLTVNDLHSFLANGAVVHNCIPHGGGGPGMGPIGVAVHLSKFLPRHPVVAGVGGDDGIGAISAAPWGSASILLISWAYIKMMGGLGLADATRVAILNANYIAKRLDPHFPVLYKGKNGFVAHECIVDLRPLKKSSGVEAEDVAKRLMDYGFHAPTLSFPVAGTLMIEPTESEAKGELDRFCDAMIAIRNEIREVEEGKQPREGNLLKNAPHTAAAVIADSWTRPYTRGRAAFPAPWVRARKFWPSVGRVNNAFGDRNLVCACPPIDDYR